MSDKAAQTQLDVFKQILGEIELRYNQVTTNDVNNQLSIKMLQNIKCTTSDRAATQVSFNQHLESYRSSMLQEHLENYHLLQEPDQMLLSKMYNFFCGLHLLVNIAELMNNVFNNFHKDPPEGTEHPEISLKDFRVPYAANMENITSSQPNLAMNASFNHQNALHSHEKISSSDNGSPLPPSLKKPPPPPPSDKKHRRSKSEPLPTEVIHRKSICDPPPRPPPPEFRKTIALLSSRKKSPVGQKFQALFDCDAGYDDELTFAEGEIILVLREEENDWWEGAIEGHPERRGLFPKTFVQPLS
ncbi:Hypothetical predicted protein [Mytilus galloprovincialis]|uniref:SH3 domain-containing protein n=1 Tax=Mytilus galloprovincialis TaxID=29158 RepID=A0A8B6CZT0_MYTGA|nr:Hypothetical predicted protein [Mytilus galloprovincialis]